MLFTYTYSKSEYDQTMPQLYTADQLTTLLGRDTETQKPPGTNSQLTKAFELLTNYNKL